MDNSWKKGHRKYMEWCLVRRFHSILTVCDVAIFTFYYSYALCEPCWSVSDVKSSSLVCSWPGLRLPKSLKSTLLCHATLDECPTCFQLPTGLCSSRLPPLHIDAFYLSVKPSILSHNSLGVQMTIVISHFLTRSVRAMEHWCFSACICTWPLGSLPEHWRDLING